MTTMAAAVTTTTMAEGEWVREWVDGLPGAPSSFFRFLIF
jgi:hypothetical protein